VRWHCADGRPAPRHDEASWERESRIARSNWQRFQANRSMYDGIYDWHTLKALVSANMQVATTAFTVVGAGARTMWIMELQIA